MNFNTRERCNNVFKTCCALHNILLEWMAQEGNQKWQTVGEFDDETSGFGEFGHEEINFFQRFKRRVYAHIRSSTDSSGVGFAVAPSFYLREETSWYELQMDLVNHFTNRFLAHDVHWI